MILTSEDIFKFNFCSYLYWHKKLPDNISPELTLFESKIIEAITLAEEHSILKNSDLNTRKILRKWDYIWWPAATKEKLSMKEADNLSLKAASIFNDYCKYDISEVFYPTVAANITLSKEISQKSILQDKINVIKTNLNSKKKSLVLLDFGNKDLSARQLTIDLRVHSKVYLFSDGNEDEIIYTYVYIDSKRNKTKLTSVIFRAEDIKIIEKNIKYIEYGILNKIDFLNQWNCEICKQCHLFKL